MAASGASACWPSGRSNELAARDSQHRDHDPNDHRTNVSAHETQDNEESLSTPTLHEIIRDDKRPRDNQEETHVIDPGNSLFPTVPAQPPANDPERVHRLTSMQLTARLGGRNKCRTRSAWLQQRRRVRSWVKFVRV